MTSRTLALGFENVFQRLLFYEVVALENPEESSMFEVIANNLLGSSPARKGHTSMVRSEWFRRSGPPVAECRRRRICPSLCNWTPLSPNSS